MNKHAVNKLFNECVSLYKILFGFDLSYMSWQFSVVPRHVDGTPCLEIPPDEYGGSWLENNTIDLNPDPVSVMRRYGVCEQMTVEDFLVTIVSHELAHEVWNNVADDVFKHDVLLKAVDEEFTTVYLDSLDASKSNFPAETFCEYMAAQVLAARKSAKRIGFPFDSSYNSTGQNRVF